MIEYENLKKTNAPFVEEYKKAFSCILDKGYYILGDAVKTFEKEFAEFCGVQYCVGVANGLDALTISLKAFDFPKDASVLVPSNTYIATILSIVNAGLKPILVEPNIHTYNIDETLIENEITNNTVAIMPVHLYGRPCNMQEILRIAKKHNLKVIEDAAQSHGAKINGSKIGGFGDATCWSFYPTKNLGALGDAGAITTNNKTLYEKLLRLRNYGSFERYKNEYVGVNSRLDEMQAAFLSIKLKKLDDINSHKNELANIYFDMLKGAPYILPQKDKNLYCVYHVFNIRCKNRNELKEYLLERGIKTDIHYPTPPNRQCAMKGILDNFSTPIAQEIHDTTLSLPISFGTTLEEVKTVCNALLDFAGCTNM